MDLSFDDTQIAFRDELRAWLAEHGPAGSLPERPEGEDERFAWARDWQRTLHSGGYAGVHWPTEVGGRGASQAETAIFFEELGRAGAPLPADVLGLLLAGPTVMTWGTPAQQERYLPTILSADETWCQGFSEPGAGSDFAAVATTAREVDGGFRVSGQKVWTSNAQYAKWCMLVARTASGDEEGASPAGKGRHKGLTYFALDMETEGVEVRPLVQITGHPEFNELFFDDAFVPDDAVIGGVGNGWRVALTTLMNERAGLAFFLQVRLRQQLDRLIDAAAGNGKLEHAGVADRIADLHVRTESLRLLAWRGLIAAETTGQPGPEGSLGKWLWSETNQLLVQLAVDVVGADALTDGESWAYELLRARGNTIEGGTTEIQKGIVAERVLELPRVR